jgi:hypothetical protein
MKNTKLFIIMVIMIAAFASLGAAADPTEGYLDGTLGPNVTRTVGSPESVIAVGGNITQANFTLEQQTSFWAGFFGNVSQFPVLEGGLNNFYTWTGSITYTYGYVLFSNASNINWNNVGGTTFIQRVEEDSALGMSGEVENINDTFTLTNSVNVNLTNNVVAGSSTAVNTSSLGGADWQTVLLEDSSTNGKIYAGITNQGNENYAGKPADYQVMIPTGSVGTRTYYVYVALQ